MNEKYRRTILAGNWKMNLLGSEVRQYAAQLRSLAERRPRQAILVCVPHIWITEAVRAFRGSAVAVGAQDVSELPSGARTGEVSAPMLRDAGVRYVIVGHSERRAYHGETDEIVARKLRAVHAEGMTPILCVGETLAQRELGQEKELIRLQLKAAFHELPVELAKKTVVAYEPIWAIGTGRSATAAQAEEMCEVIRAQLRELYGARPARAISILYGGSMKPDNAAELLAQPDVDGGLIGGASLDAQQFHRIIKAVGL